MSFTKLAFLFLINLIILQLVFLRSLNNPKEVDYRGIWLTLGRDCNQFEGDKISGGLAFCFSHTKLFEYRKTFTGGNKKYWKIPNK